MKRWLPAVALALFALVIYQAMTRDSGPGPAPAGAEAPAAPKLSLKTLDGTPVDLADLRGKVVAVNFWATWCGPCRVELPQLAEFWRSRHDQCFELLGVAGMSGRVDTEQMAKEIPYPVLFDEDGTTVDAWSVRAVPKTFLLDTEGRVRQVFRGAVGKDELARAVDPLLPRSCPRKSG